MVDLNMTKCTGCGACCSICPANAITMQENSEGFLSPIIDKNKCSNCGLCLKTCPVLNPIYENNENPSCYAVIAFDEIRSVSSSGGVFPILAYYFLNQGGYVAGAVWTSEAKVQHIVSNKKEDIEKMRGSKYLQSEIGECYKDVKNLLVENNKVLFTGTPCQISGLKAFLKKEYENLFTVDLVCHGVPSPKVFKKYLEESLENDEVFIETNFRDKVCGWSPSLTTTTTTTTTIRKISRSASEDDYMIAFLKNLSLRNSCNECLFNKLPRQADISIGDFWGIDKFDKKLNDKKGTSVLLVNNSKGDSLLKKVFNKYKLVKSVPLKYALQGNPTFLSPFKAHENKGLFYEVLEKEGLKAAVSRSLQTRYDGVILNYWFSGTNYGAVLTAYCIQQYLKKYFDKDYRLVNWKVPYWQKKYKGSFCEKFAKENLSLTKEFASIKELKDLNAFTDNFIVGSDQVFRYNFIRDIKEAYLLEFTDFSKKRIAFAASFGIDTFEAGQIEKYEVKKSLKRFDAISTREDSGVKICSSDFNLEAEHILDPVFLVEGATIENFVDKESKKYEGKIVTYILDSSEEIVKNIKELSEKLGMEIVSLAYKNISMEEWLTAIYNCEYFVTDSFHGACCAILFKKKFLCLKNKTRGTARFDSIQRTFNIEQNFIYDASEIQNLEKINSFVKWDYIQNVLEKERERAYKWLKRALDAEKKYDNEKLAEEMDFLKSGTVIVKHINKNIYKKRESFLEKIFSVRNEGQEESRHKVLKILGIKIKIRVRKKFIKRGK